MTTPERIKVEPAGDWADVWDASDEARVGTGAEVLYVRADIYANAVAERDRLRRALEYLLEVGCCAGYGVEEARAALSGKEVA